MKIIIFVILLIVAYFLIKGNKKSQEKKEKTSSMVMCNECGFHVLENNLCTSKEEINQCHFLGFLAQIISDHLK